MDNDYGLWTMVVFNIALFGLFLVGFLQPRGRSEWRSFGLVAAFLVALFTEMYGVPLTIYLLSSALGRAPFPNPFAHTSGNLVASLLGLGPGWATFFMGLGGVVMFVGVGIVAAAWRRIHAGRERLVTDGPYAVVRHPQYSGLMVTIAGTLIQWPTAITLFMAPILIVSYCRLARREEKVMIARFGDTYRHYMAAVPMLVPRLHRNDAPTALRSDGRSPEAGQAAVERSEGTSARHPT